MRNFFTLKEHITSLVWRSQTALDIARCTQTQNGLDLSSKTTDPSLLQLDKSAFIVTALEEETQLVRSLFLPVKKDKEIQELLPYQLDTLFPYPRDELLWEITFQEKKEEGTLLFVTGTTKNALKQHLISFQEHQIEPDIVTTTSCALAVFCAHKTESQEVILSLFGNEPMFCAVASLKGSVLASHTFTSEEEIPRVLLGIKKKLPYPVSSTLYLIGKTPRDLKGFTTKILSEETDCLAQGLALLPYLLPTAPNYRKEAWQPPHPLKRQKKALGLFAFSSLLFTCCFFLFASVYLSQKQQQLTEEAIRLQQQKGSEHTLKEPASLEEIEQTLFATENTSQKTTIHFPLHPNVPRLSDVLAWLATHPQVQGQIDIKDLHYQMIKRPDGAKPKEKYQVKLDITFTSQTPKQAREFHDALLAPNPFVDPKGEIKWTTNRGAYKTSFTLKDKTVYP